MDSEEEVSKSSQDWTRLWEIFHQARKKNPAERADFLNDIDSTLRSEVEELLAIDRNDEHVLEGLVVQELGQLHDSKVIEIKSNTVLAGRFPHHSRIGKRRHGDGV